MVDTVARRIFAVVFNYCRTHLVLCFWNLAGAIDTDVAIVWITCVIEVWLVIRHVTVVSYAQFAHRKLRFEQFYGR